MMDQISQTPSSLIRLGGNLAVAFLLVLVGTVAIDWTSQQVFGTEPWLYCALNGWFAATGIIDAIALLVASVGFLMLLFLQRNGFSLIVLGLAIKLLPALLVLYLGVLSCVGS